MSPRDQLATRTAHVQLTRAHLISPRDQLAMKYCACAVSCNGNNYAEWKCAMEICNGNMQMCNGNVQWKYAEWK